MADKLFSVLIGCYGDYPQYSLRCIDSVLMQENVDTLCDIHVGCCQCCNETLDGVWENYRDGFLTSVVVTQENINKDPMMRLLVERTTTPYVLWFDDDSHIGPGFLQLLDEFIRKNHPFDGAGKIYFIRRRPQYLNFVRQRPWWKEYTPPATPGSKSSFPTGGLWAARTDFMRQHDFPDRGMIKRSDDIIFGELLQQHGKMISFTSPMIELMHISDGDRRGGGEGPRAWGIMDGPDVQEVKP